MYDIFISYRSTNRDWVKILAHNLKDQGYAIFLDDWELIPGQDFPTQIHQALSDSRCAILVATPEASDSGWVQQELQTMVNLKNSRTDFFFIPVVMGRFPDLPFVETVQAVDFGESGEDRYRRAFHRLLSGLAQRSPGADDLFRGDLRLPGATFQESRLIVGSESTFVETLFRRMQFGRPLMILAQADTNTQIYSDAMRTIAETRFGADQVFHIFPPNSEQADSAAYFGRLARQCRLEGPCRESWEWAELLAKRIDDGHEFLLLVTGFENGPEGSRKAMAGELRQLCERYYRRFHLIMMGSRRLAALKYENERHSLLNIADEVTIPELAPRELPELFGRLYPDLQLAQTALQEIFSFTGCHPRLLHYCLQQGADSATACRTLLDRSPLPVQLFTQFRDPDEHPALRDYLNRTELGRFEIWPTDELLRRLYWCNLTTCREGHFKWRCEYIRRTGLEITA